MTTQPTTHNWFVNDAGNIEVPAADQLLNDTHVAGGWTEPATITRRICTALWKATGAFGRIENYHSDVIIDYETFLSIVKDMGEHCEVHLVYVIGKNGTTLQMVDYNEVDPLERAFGDDRGGNTGRFLVELYRSDGDRYGLVVNSLTATL